MKLHSQLEISVPGLLKLYTPHWLKWDEESFPLWLFMKCETTMDCDAWVKGAAYFSQASRKDRYYLLWNWGREAFQIGNWTRGYLFGWNGNVLGLPYFSQKSLWGEESKTFPSLSTGAGMWAFGAELAWPLSPSSHAAQRRPAVKELLSPFQESRPAPDPFLCVEYSCFLALF